MRSNNHTVKKKKLSFCEEMHLSPALHAEAFTKRSHLIC